MECREIQKMLSAYLEEMASPGQERLIREHLISCGQCRTALEDLRRMKGLVKGLDEMDPPPWLAQKIMAQVREEAEKRGGILRRLFYPLRIKIPIQAIATVLVVGLAAYVYKANLPQYEAARVPPRTEKILPGQEPQKRYDEAARGQATGRSVPETRPADTNALRAGAGPDRTSDIRGKQEEAQTARLAEERAIVEQKQAEAGRSAQPERSAQPGRSAPPGRPAQPERSAPPERPAQPERPAPQRSVVAAPASEEAALSRQEAAPAPKQPDEPLSGELKKGEKGMSEKMRAVKEEPALGVTVRVSDAGRAATEVESLLGSLGARNVARHSREGAESITAELSGDKVDDLLEKMRGIGDAKPSQPYFPVQNVAIRIEIISR